MATEASQAGLGWAGTCWACWLLLLLAVLLPLLLLMPDFEWDPSSEVCRVLVIFVFGIMKGMYRNYGGHVWTSYRICLSMKAMCANVTSECTLHKHLAEHQK